ncbi:MAG: DoxX family protein [Arachnia sp.]
MKAALQFLRDIALMLARVVVGVVMVAHGWHRWQIAGIPEQVGQLDAAGIGYSASVVWAVIAFEIIGGILLAFGLATPAVGLALTVMNVGVIVLLRAQNGFYVYEQGWEYNAVLAAFGLIFLAFGSGRAGLDHLFMRPPNDSDELIVDESEEGRITPQPF